MNDLHDFDPDEGQGPDGAASKPTDATASGGSKRRKAKDLSALYEEALEQAASLKAKLTARRAENRDRLVEDLFRRFGVAEVNRDFDETQRIATLLSRLEQHLGRMTALAP